MALKAGIGQTDISPTKSMFLCGYPHVPRMSTGVHDPLLATALYLDNGYAALLLIGLDILFISKAMTLDCRAELAHRIGVPAENILISSTHTHSGPVTINMLMWRDDPILPPTDPEYLAMVRQRIIDAGLQARAEAVPAVAAITTACAKGVGGNRLSKDGPADPEVGILYVKKKDDLSPLAIDIVYSMHPTVMHEDSTLVSADFPGAARRRIEDRLQGAKLVYHTGPEGNQSPRYWVSGQTFEECDRLGYKLGDAVLSAVEALPDSAFSDDLPLAAAGGSVAIPPRVYPPVAQARAHLEQAVATFERLKRDGAPHGPVRTAECAVFGAEEAVVLAESQETGELQRWQAGLNPAELQVLKVGDTFLVGIPGEVFVEYGLEIKRRAPSRAFAMCLVNGELHGYIVTPEADAEGGYEASNSFFRPESGTIMVDEALRLMAGLSG